MVPSSPAAEKQAPVEPGPDLERQSWQCLVFYLCFYGFMAQMRPGESFITPYLLGPDKNFTKEQVTNEITPVLSYSYMVVLVPIFLLTDYLRYKPVLLLQGLSYMAVWLLLLLGHSVPHMQLMEVFYSITMAARIAYSSYIFSLVRPARYQRMAGYSRTAVLLGVFTSSVLGQLLVTAGRIPFSTLNYISLAFLTFSLVLALFLKRPKRSLFFNRGAQARRDLASELDHMNPVSLGQPQGKKLGRALLVACQDWVLVRMLRELGDNLRQPQLRLWSLWWVFNSAGYYLVVYYVHILWSVVQPAADSARVYNGAADAASTLLGAITSFAAGFVKIRWTLWSKLVIAGVTATQAGLVFLLYSTRNIWLCYAAFVLFRGSYQFLVPIATFQIASSLSKELCALVFGVNTFFATIVKTTITLIVSDVRGLGLPVHSQFLLYFVYFLVLSAIYLSGAVLDGLRHFQRGHHQPLPLAQELKSPSAEKTAQVLTIQDEGLGDLQPLTPPLLPEDRAWALEPASLGQRQPGPAWPVLPVPAQPAARFLTPEVAPPACTPCPDQALTPDVADVMCLQPAAYPLSVSQPGLQLRLNSSVQSVNQ
ncbi:folate transporter 1 [Carlito syrichta]|uniref:Reduced folate transporter n=1 Tax=Carlito syrichta TaxID=1868482 RepID=A0A1U7U393_CARSF|nr:folate transporter 1 [Carlito syrichta]